MLDAKYRTGLVLLLLALVITALVSLVVPSAGASTAGAPVWLPYMVKPATNGARGVTSFALPFNVLPGVSPEFVQDADFFWYFTVYRIDAGDQNGAYVLRWQYGDQVASIVQKVSDVPAILGTQAIDNLTPARGTLAHDYDRQRLYFFGFNDTDNPRRPNIDVFVIDSYIP